MKPNGQERMAAVNKGLPQSFSPLLVFLPQLRSQPTAVVGVRVVARAALAITNNQQGVKKNKTIYCVVGVC